jgi:polysaccharide pyruvyl transferase WcaK-like protein
MWLRTVRLYRSLGVQVFFYGVSVGPIRDRSSLALVGDILRAADGHTFRDRASIDLMRDVLPDDVLTQAADPVLSLVAPRAPDGEPWPAAPLCVGFNVRTISSIPGERAEDEGARLAGALLDKLDARLRFLPMSADDVILAGRIRARLGTEQAARVEIGGHDAGDLAAHVAAHADLDLVVTMRLHTSVLATLYGVPVVGLDCNAKIPGFLGEVGLAPFVSRVSDGIETYEIDVGDVLDKIWRLRDAWPELRAETFGRVRALVEREQKNMAGLVRVLATRS